MPISPTMNGVAQRRPATAKATGYAIAVVPAAEAFKAIDVLRAHGHQAKEIGEIVEGHGEVLLR